MHKQTIIKHAHTTACYGVAVAYTATDWGWSTSGHVGWCARTEGWSSLTYKKLCCHDTSIVLLLVIANYRYLLLFITRYTFCSSVSSPLSLPFYWRLWATKPLLSAFSTTRGRRQSSLTSCYIAANTKDTHPKKYLHTVARISIFTSHPIANIRVGADINY